MKVLCEVPLEVNSYEESQFSWLENHDGNILFVIEMNKRLRMVNVKFEPAKEVQSASLSDSRLCTNFSWNRTQSLLAIVVDRKQLFLWEIMKNSFIYFKPQSATTQLLDTGQPSSASLSRKPLSKDIEFVVWSKVSDKLALCYSSGQILLCKFANNSFSSSSQNMNSITSVWEKFIDNSGSERIIAIEVSEHCDSFACFSVISEILVMTFDGQTIFYSQSAGIRFVKARFSPLTKKFHRRSCSSDEQSSWLAYQSSNNSLSFKMVCRGDSDNHELAPKLDAILYPIQNDELKQMPHSKLVSFHWLSASHLIACLASGVILLIRIHHQHGHAHLEYQSTNDNKKTEPPDIYLVTEELVRIEISKSLQGNSDQTLDFNRDEHEEQFNWFELRRLSPKNNCPKVVASSSSFALAAGTDHKLFYYELHHVEGQQCYAEKIDDIDLKSNLLKLHIKLERAQWNHDCSMLAVQLTSGHVLVYRTRLPNYMVATYGSKSAYMSGPNDVTILNYDGQEESSVLPIQVSDSVDLGERTVSSSSSTSNGQSENASVLNVSIRPSLIAIGPKHLALALNNRARFYSLELIRRNCKQKFGEIYECHDSPTNPTPRKTSKTSMIYTEQQYVTVVSGISMNSRYVGTMFVDGRIKLHPIGCPPCDKSARNNSPSRSETLKESIVPEDESEIKEEEENINERFFPDPSRQEGITTFVLTEDLLVYSTKGLEINSFSLRSWAYVQVCNHSEILSNPILKLKPNASGTKFICLSGIRNDRDRPPVRSESLTRSNAYLYDLYHNKVLSLTDSNLFEDLTRLTIEETLKLIPYSLEKMQNIIEQVYNHKFKTEGSTNCNKLSEIIDAVWDTDGRGVLLIERNYMHLVAILDHTLDRDEPVGMLAATTDKPSGYQTLYASQGIVSFQTILGRVINAILRTHDEESKLSELECAIRSIKKKILSASADSSQFSEYHSEGSRGPNGSDWKEEHLTGLELPLDFELRLKIQCLKLQYMRTILPIYSLAKCREIYQHLAKDEQFNLPTRSCCHERDIFKDQETYSIDTAHHCYTKLIDQLPWKHLAAWSLFTLNLDHAMFIYRKYGLTAHAFILNGIIEDLRDHGNDSNLTVRQKLLFMLRYTEV